MVESKKNKEYVYKSTIKLRYLYFISHILSTYTSYFIIAVAVVTFFCPAIFSWVHGDIQSLILGFIMLTMGLTLTLDDMRIHAEGAIIGLGKHGERNMILIQMLGNSNTQVLKQ